MNRPVTVNNIDMIAFHNPCMDGLAAAWVAYTAVNDYMSSLDESELVGRKEIALVGLDNRQIIEPTSFVEQFRDRTVIMVDYAPPKAILEQVVSVCKGFYLLDHHITNRDDLAGQSYAHFDMGKSGVGLAWEYFNPEKTMPRFLQLIQDRDLWSKQFPESDVFNNGLSFVLADKKTFHEKFTVFDELSDNEETKLAEILTIGKLLYEKRNRDISFYLSQTLGKVYHWEGKHVYIVNCSSELISDLGNALANKEECHFAVLWNYNHQNEEYRISLRSANKVDVSAICKRYGGGGHPNAAGMTSKIHPSVLFSS
jgi:oligoribonuclease NrnB/cAMP/cGMP phosphodiesterase (DHH superfamily)